MIEHIDNPGLMLENIKNLMHEKTILIITTPNPWSKRRIWLMQHGHLEKAWLNKEHVAWYSYQTLKQMLERNGYSEVMYDYYFGDSYEKLDGDCIGFKGWIRKQMRKYDRKNREKCFYDGLFFVSNLSKGDKNEM